MSSATVTTPPLAIPKVPFRGIEPFRFVDQNIFFARKESTQKLLRTVTLYRGVLFYGDSGSGKSSLINAGLIPAAMEEGFAPERLRVQPRRGEEIIVERISTNPDGKAPYLPSIFSGADDTARVVLSTESLMRRVEAIDEDSQSSWTLLIFDQFEEFVTLFEEAPRKGDEIQEATEAQGSILRMIVTLMREPRLNVKLLLVFREDYLAKLSKLFALCPDLPDQSLRLTAPGVSSLDEIIRGSFEKFPGQFGKELSQDLTKNLTEAIKARSDTNKINLSEVQIACLKLWQSENPDKLFEEKGVQGLLEDYLADSLKRLPSDLQDVAIALLSRMVTPSGTRNIVSEYDLISQLNEDEGLPEDKVRGALQALVQETKLVRRERRYDTYFYDIVSEFLVPWIMRKKTDRLAEAARRELEAVERLKRRRAYQLTIASVLVAVGIGLVALWVYKNRTVSALAQDNVQAAEAQRLAAIAEKDQASLLAAQAIAVSNQAEKAKNDAFLQKQLAEQALTALQASKDKEIQALKSRAEKAEQEFTRSKQELAKVLQEKSAVEKELDRHRDEKDKAEREALAWKAKYNSLVNKYRVGTTQSRPGA